ncbi:MAG: RND family transporter [Actinobacteria bacterium]|jgi:hydrophobe/amphiphile efflux-3 (HAE3) family protein|nr:MAG: RND family transporter [Actinomycetota bacterium]
MRRLTTALVTAGVKRPWLVITIIALITVAAFIGALRVEMEFSQRSLMPEGYESIEAIKQVEEDFGGIQYDKVLLGGVDFTSPEAALALYGYDQHLQAKADPFLREEYVLGVESYLSQLARNPQAAPIFRLAYAVEGSGTAVEFASAVDHFLSDPGTAPLREYRDAAPLFELLESTVDSEDPLAKKSLVESVLGAALEQAVEGYLEDPGAAGFVLGRTISDAGDGHAHALLRIQVRPDLPQARTIEYAQQLKDFTEEYFAPYGITAEVSGETYIMKDVQDLSMRDGLILGLAALAFIVLVLFFTFRKLLDVILTLAVVSISTLWVFGLMGFTGVRFTIMSIAIVPLLLGIDIAYSIHILMRYYEERDKGSGAGESAANAVVTVGVAVFLAAATTMFGFLSFSISDLPPIKDFGLLCLAGVFFGYALSVLLLPAALVIRDRRRGAVARRRVETHRLLDWVDRGLIRLSMLAEKRRKVVWALSLVLVVGCIALAFGLSTAADMRNFVPQDMPSYEIFNRLEQYFGGQDSAVALVEGEDLLSPESLRSMHAFVQDVLEDPRNLTPEGEEVYFQSNRVNSLPTIFNALDGELPASSDDAEAALEKAGEEYGFDTSALITPAGDKALIVFEIFFRDEAAEEEMAAILKDNARDKEGLSPASPRYRVTGMPLIISDTMDKLFSTQLKTSALALILCALLVILIFRSIYCGLAATSVVFLAIALELGILRLMGWPLDIMTVMIASMVIGAGIDFGIHVAHRFREEVYENGLKPVEAINATVRNVGTALLSAAVTTCGAFLILAISSLTTLRRFGIITAIALASACFAALVLEPSFLASIALRKEKKSLEPTSAAPQDATEQ